MEYSDNGVCVEKCDLNGRQVDEKQLVNPLWQICVRNYKTVILTCKLHPSNQHQIDQREVPSNVPMNVSQ